MKDSLDICFKTANILKSSFPNEVMRIEPSTIIAYSTKNSRLLKNRGGMSNLYAYYTKSKPHRIVVKQKILKNPLLYSTYGGSHSLNPLMTTRRVIHRFAKCSKCRVKFDEEVRYIDKPTRTLLSGNWALIDLMCHELAHHRTTGHANGFKVKYQKFLDHMTNQVISGEFYNN